MKHTTSKPTPKDQTPSTTASTKVSKKAQLEQSRKPSVTKIQMSSSTGHISPISVSSPSSGTSSKAVRESNYTPSISSIGSVLLRSKTADFERILSDQNKKSRISATGLNLPALKTSHNVQSMQAKIQPQANPNVTNINISLKTSSSKKKLEAPEPEKRMPIKPIKRQEIISSVQKTVKK